MASKTAAAKRQDRLLALSIGLGTLLTAGSVWAYATFKAPAVTERPKPAWLSLPMVQPQLADGRMLAIEVALEFDQQEDLVTMKPHAPAFKALVEEAARGLSPHDVRGPAGIERCAQAIEEAINDYLHEQHMRKEVRQVAFSQMLLTP